MPLRRSPDSGNDSHGEANTGTPWKNSTLLYATPSSAPVSKSNSLPLIYQAGLSVHEQAVYVPFVNTERSLSSMSTRSALPEPPVTLK